MFKDAHIFRAGGDEFVVIIRNIKEKEVLELLNKLKETALKNNVSFAYGYSMTNNPKDVEKILKEADSNMYNNKRNYYNSLNNN